jgi:3-oxoacyl-[acyl-carrier-protein] synthase-3
MTTSGIYIQERLGARRAWAVDVMQKCSSFAAGVRLGRALLRSEPGMENVLLCGGYRNGDLVDYRNPRVSFMYNLSAGGGAALLSKNCARNTVLGSAIITDGALARHVVARYGGTVAPVTHDNVDAARRCLDVVDPEGMRLLLAERSHGNFLRVIRESLAESGLPPKALDYLAILHMKRSAHEAVLADLGLRAEQSTYLSRFGHVGQFDQILSLELAAADGRLRDGDTVVAVGAGIGYAWGAVALRWGEERPRRRALPLGPGEPASARPEVRA